MVVASDAGEQVVTVVPVTHTPPSDPNLAVEIPPLTKRRLKLDDSRSWVVIAEANQFAWPGPDLRLGASGDAASVAYGQLPRALFDSIRNKLAAAIKARRLQVVARTH